MQYLNDEYVMYSLITLTVSIAILIIFLISYKKITIMIEKYEARKKEDAEREKKKTSTGKESFVAEIEKEYMTKLDKLQIEYNDKMIKASTLVLKIKNITSSLSPQVIIKEIQELLKNNLPVNKAVIYLKRKDSGNILLAGGVGTAINDQVIEEFPVEQIPLVAHSFYAKKLVHIEDACADKKIQELLLSSTQKFIYALPLLAIAEGELVPSGAIAIEKFNDQITALASEDLSLLSMLSTIIGNALYNAADLESSKKFSEEQLLEKKKLTKIFSKYVSSQIVDELMKNPDSTALGGKKQKTTILFSDIRGFTSMSEKFEPEAIVSLLNEYFSEMSGVIFNWNGTLDKYIGDAMMVLFGAPILGSDDELRAVTAAIEMQRKLKKLNEFFDKKGQKTIGVGIGINTGDVVVGNIGSENRLEYTAIGDSVNLASRLCSVAKAGQIIISDFTYNHVKDFIEVNKLEMVQVKGKAEKIQIYEVLNLK
ncbi:MAG TPA: adenylate/guanylate cyclase domain-containing protein [Candidatus Wallbacteria bacterium]|mgnify:CR=1 FL=1|nr:MAG: Adenylate cyclase 2 [bacterium ADurb.Bin243]HPG57670.1 adenylate/guanylate cyclase domain-containing protein [Candidatus Wallbacteria bacterium]